MCRPELRYRRLHAVAVHDRLAAGSARRGPPGPAAGRTAPGLRARASRRSGACPLAGPAHPAVEPLQRRVPAEPGYPVGNRDNWVHVRHCRGEQGSADGASRRAAPLGRHRPAGEQADGQPPWSTGSLSGMDLTQENARQLLSGAQVARLATVTSAGRPHIVPVTFAVAGDYIYTAVDAKPKATANLQRLRNIRANPQVAVLADHYDDDWTALWWARAAGRAAWPGAKPWPTPRLCPPPPSAPRTVPRSPAPPGKRNRSPGPPGNAGRA